MTDRTVTGDPSHAVTGDPSHAVTGDPSHAVIGDAPRRREDARFVTGHGTYLDDLRFDGVTHAVFVRSPHAHARIIAIDTTDALKAAGAVAILTARDAAADGLRPLRPTVEANVQTNEPFRFLPQPLLAEDIVRYAGEPIALVIAETRHQALDAAERIAIDFELLPTVTRACDAPAPDAPLLAGDVPGNVCFDWHWGQTVEVADAPSNGLPHDRRRSCPITRRAMSSQPPASPLMPEENSRRYRLTASPTSAPTWRADPAACRPTNIRICKAQSTLFQPSPCASERC
jgi:hypothetical protein